MVSKDNYIIPEKSIVPKDWVSLSDDEIREEIDWVVSSDNGVTRIIEFARAIEQALKEKNS